MKTKEDFLKYVEYKTLTIRITATIEEEKSFADIKKELTESCINHLKTLHGDHFSCYEPRDCQIKVYADWEDDLVAYVTLPNETDSDKENRIKREESEALKKYKNHIERYSKLKEKKATKVDLKNAQKEKKEYEQYLKLKEKYEK